MICEGGKTWLSAQDKRIADLEVERSRLRDALESIEQNRELIPSTNDNYIWGYMQTIVDIAKQALEDKNES